MISAEIILDSVSPEGHRLTTMKLRYPKFIHGEFMTHRVFSRNASFSGAVPVEKNINEVRSDDRAAPVFWGKNQKGMQGYEELEGPSLKGAKSGWERAALEAAETAEWLYSIGTHKQIVNRILEPFLHINVLVSATEYDNFFGLRLDAGADPTMQALARAMWEARKNSTPKLLKPREWHLPFVDWPETMDDFNMPGSWLHKALRVSVARCCRISYESHETKKRSTMEEDLALYDRLVGAQPIHASPAEHQATPDTISYPDVGFDPGWSSLAWSHPAEHGNFLGWRQYRQRLPDQSCAPLPEGFLP